MEANMWGKKQSTKAHTTRNPKTNHTLVKKKLKKTKIKKAVTLQR